MKVSTIAIPTTGPDNSGIRLTCRVHYQLSPQGLFQDVLRRREGVLNDSGALVIKTGKFTGRSPNDKFIVRDASTDKLIDWNQFNRPIGPEHFDIVFNEVTEYLGAREEVWMRDCIAGADLRYQVAVRIINEKPSSDLFCYNMFLRPAAEGVKDQATGWLVLCAPGLQLDPIKCGVRQPNAALISFSRKTILIAGTGYTGEIKKGIFTVLNLLMPAKKVLSMHCSANCGEAGDTALFFGLSGTGKTTLSADPARRLIGDDEHGWSDKNVFNFEGGCYAKTIDLSEENEPAIFRAIRPGALLENTTFLPDSDKTDYSSRKITENTRVSYPIHYIGNAQIPSIGNIPSNIFFLTCDAYGVLPPISKLTPEQAMYQFLSGYTAKIAGTETGINEPVPTFSACFGAPFLPLPPADYARMLGEKLKRHKVNVWLVNTGWTGGSYGTGSRIRLAHTRAMISAALNGRLEKVHYDEHPVFRMKIPVACDGVPSSLLYPRDNWKDKDAYDREARKLALLFNQNFSRFAATAGDDVMAAGPLFS